MSTTDWPTCIKCGAYLRPRGIEDPHLACPYCEGSSVRNEPEEKKDWRVASKWATEMEARAIIVGASTGCPLAGWHLEERDMDDPEKAIDAYRVWLETWVDVIKEALIKAGADEQISWVRGELEGFQHALGGCALFFGEERDAS